LTEAALKFCTQEGRPPVIGSTVEFSITNRDPDKAAPLEGRGIPGKRLYGSPLGIRWDRRFFADPKPIQPASELLSVVLYAQQIELMAAWFQKKNPPG